jgi:hypothetical protein
MLVVPLQQQELNRVTIMEWDTVHKLDMANSSRVMVRVDTHMMQRSKVSMDRRLQVASRRLQPLLHLVLSMDSSSRHSLRSHSLITNHHQVVSR